VLMTMWKRLVIRLGDDERGAIAVQFALLLIPIAILTFGLIDISRASVQKRQLQDALDAATLMAARSTATTNTDLDTIGDAALATEMTGLGVTFGPSNSTFVLGDNNTVVGTIQNIVIKPIISNLWTTKETPIAATATVMRSVNKLEVALVLDNTGSMASNLGSGGKKIDALITASKSLVDVLGAAAARASEPDAVKLAVVPFSMTVNVGSSYQGQSWLSGVQPAAYGADNFASGGDRFAYLSNLGLSWRGCVESRPAPFDISDAPPVSGTGGTLFVPFFAPDEPDDNTVNKPSSSNKYRDARTVNGGTIYNNWITRDMGYNGANSSDWNTRQKAIAKYGPSDNTNKNKTYVIDDAKDTDTDYGPNAGCGIASLLRMQNLRTAASVTTVKNKLNEMVASGNTNVAMGAMWGWHVISPNAPFSDGSPYGTRNVTKVIVLLTDGDNVMSSASNPNEGTYSGYGYAEQGRLLDANNSKIDGDSSDDERRDAMDSRQKKLCAAARAAPNNVQIYSIGVGVSAHSKVVLKACATREDMYYDVTDAAQLTSVFNTIAGSIQNLRITK
jgi:Flp pilus assembly protein TadG